MSLTFDIILIRLFVSLIINILRIFHKYILIIYSPMIAAENNYLCEKKNVILKCDIEILFCI